MQFLEGLHKLPTTIWDCGKSHEECNAVKFGSGYCRQPLALLQSSVGRRTVVLKSLDSH